MNPENFFSVGAGRMLLIFDVSLAPSLSLRQASHGGGGGMFMRGGGGGGRDLTVFIIETGHLSY